MDTEPQNTTNSDVTMVRTSDATVSAAHHLLFGLASLLVVVVATGAVYLWQHHKVSTLNTQIKDDHAALTKDAALSLDHIRALKALPNIVEDSANSPANLLAFLGADNTRCYLDGGTGYYKVVAQANDQFAEMQYGCTAKGGTTPLGPSPAHILAKRTAGSWSLISPSNQWLSTNGQDVPSCKMVNDNKFSKLVTPQCWNGPATGDPGSSDLKNYSVVPVTNP